MRKQQRPDSPQVLQDHGARLGEQWAALRAKNPVAAFQWYSVDGATVRDHILPHLQAMSQEHCAFCDAFPLADRTLEPIEHFRPKSWEEFYLFAYEWTNLYYCCDVCQSRKGEKWSELLLRPDDDGYEFANYFIFDFTNGRIDANPEAPCAVKIRAAATIQMFGLDLPEKRRFRMLEARKWSNSAARTLDDFSYRDFVQPQL